MLSHSIPDIPFYKIAIDIAEFGGKSYLIIEDYYSRWLEILKLYNKTSDAVIDVLKELFSRLGVPKKVIADNMPFGSLKFSQFSIEWNFQIITSSPHYAQSNGLAERGVGIAKDMLRKSDYTGLDINLFLLTYRNTPIAGVQYSPAQLLMSRELRGTLLVNKQKFKLMVVTIHNKIKQNKDRQKYWYNLSARKTTDEYSKGQLINIQNKFDKRWYPGEIIKKLPEPRSYLVKDGKGKVLRRNSQWLKKKKEYAKESDIIIEDDTEEKKETSVSNETEADENIVKKTKSGRLIKKLIRYL